MAKPSSVTLPGEMDSLYTLISFVTSYAGEHGFVGEKISAIELALEEVLVNIIKHAYKESGIEGTIEISCSKDDADSLIIEIMDSGMPFDIFSVREPDISADIDERQVGGLGIFFVKKLMDYVRYRREDDRNILTLVVNDTISSSDKE
ncbi:MAG: ATP-binding protein [Syntrophomonas sp.]